MKFVGIDYSMSTPAMCILPDENAWWKDSTTHFLTDTKKFATGKGNAKKEQMYEAITQDQGLDLSKLMGQEGKLASPVTDVIDAYYIAKYAQGVYREQQNSGRPQTP